MAYFNTNSPKALNEALKEYLDDVPNKKRLKRGMVLSLWAETVGKKINEHTDDLYFEYGNLVIQASNNAWQHELHMKRFNIAKKLNKKVGGKIVKKIVVRSA